MVEDFYTISTIAAMVGSFRRVNFASFAKSEFLIGFIHQIVLVQLILFLIKFEFIRRFDQNFHLWDYPRVCEANKKLERKNERKKD